MGVQLCVGDFGTVFQFERTQEALFKEKFTGDARIDKLDLLSSP